MRKVIIIAALFILTACGGNFNGINEIARVRVVTVSDNYSNTCVVSTILVTPDGTEIKSGSLDRWYNVPERFCIDLKKNIGAVYIMTVNRSTGVYDFQKEE